MYTCGTIHMYTIACTHAAACFTKSATNWLQRTLNGSARITSSVLFWPRLWTVPTAVYHVLSICVHNWPAQHVYDSHLSTDSSIKNVHAGMLLYGALD